MSWKHLPVDLLPLQPAVPSYTNAKIQKSHLTKSTSVTFVLFVLGHFQNPSEKG